MKRKKLFLMILLAILLLFGYAFCAAPLMTFSVFHYYGTITAWTAFIFVMEEIFWDFLTNKDKNNDETKN